MAGVLTLGRLATIPLLRKLWKRLTKTAVTCMNVYTTTWSLKRLVKAFMLCVTQSIGMSGDTVGGKDFVANRNNSMELSIGL